MARWFVYIIECRDGSLYTGIAVDVERRFQQHMAGKGARYTRSHPPLRLLGNLELADRSEASRAEHAIKQLSAPRKRAMCEAWTMQAATTVNTTSAGLQAPRLHPLQKSASSTCSSPYSETAQTTVRR